MIILHAGMYKERFLIWAEASRERESPAPRRQGKKLKSPGHPYAAKAGQLLEALKIVNCHPEKRRISEALIWLPAHGPDPLPSSPLIAEPPLSNAKTTLNPWAIPVYSATLEETINILCASMDRRMIASGTKAGADLLFWTSATRFASSLVVRQQYLPDLTADDEYRAVWEPVYTGEDGDHLNSLAERMPAVARAFSDPEATSPPEWPAALVLKEFIRSMLDHLVRSAAPRAGQGAEAAKRSAFDSVHDAWLYALRDEDNAVRADGSDLERLRAQIREWRRPVAISELSPFRLCFRLEEPEEEVPDSWYVRYFLQPRNDPSLLFPVGDAWKATGRKAAILKAHGANAREYVLSSLGQAASVCPHIAGSLDAAKPSGYELDTTQAHQFLTEKSLLLEQFGFGILLPAWWSRKGTKTRLAVRARIKSPKMQGDTRLSLDEIVRFDWEMALGGKTLTPSELETLARLKSPLVRLRGQWVEMTGQDIRAAIDFWKKKPSGEETARGIIRMALGAGSAPGGLEIGGVDATGWMGELLGELGGKALFQELPAPKGFQGTLRPYQVRGYSWLTFLRKWGLGACLADDMGLGKTIQTLALIERDWESNGKRPVLLICPTSVIYNWHLEAGHFTPSLPVLVHYGVDRQKGAAFKKAAQKHALVLSSYGTLQRDLKLLQEVSWAGIVLDEAQNIKNPETKQARAARSLQADYRIVLTGTPVENNIGDLWSLMEFLNPGLLGTQADFKRRFFIPIQAGRDPEAAALLKRITGPFILRRLKTDKSIISDLPEKLETKVFCTLTKEQASLYAAVLKEVEEALNETDGIQRKGIILRTLSKLKQVCNHPAQFLRDNSALPDRSGKLSRLTEMLEEILAIGDRALIFSQFAEMGGILRHYLQEVFGEEVLFLHGGTPKAKRDSMVERFQKGNGGPSIFILSLKAGGTGLNLTRANHVFHYDRWWNPAVENQATDRAFRIGQKQNVQVHKFICAGTMEEKIDGMIDRKREMAEKVIGAGEGWLTELSNEELKQVFSLRKEATGE